VVKGVTGCTAPLIHNTLTLAIHWSPPSQGRVLKQGIPLVGQLVGDADTGGWQAGRLRRHALGVTPLLLCRVLLLMQGIGGIRLF